MNGTTSTEASRAAALTMFDDVPCFFQMLSPGCEERACWIARFVHEEPGGCDGTGPWPVCETHKQALHRVSVPFWRVWFAAEPIPCGACGVPLRLDRFEALK